VKTVRAAQDSTSCYLGAIFLNRFREGVRRFRNEVDLLQFPQLYFSASQ